MSAACIFCKIIKGEIPSIKLFETAKTYAFADIQPLSKGHALVIPKEHAVKLHELSDESLADLLPAAKKLAVAVGADEYNILQNNGPMAHQVVKHVHIHMIPKPNEEEGLKVGWPATNPEKDELAKYWESIKQKL
ncbi:HIT-like protein [Saitoella complicata NRRL Y-17804]|uniref:HIT-like protein n=1 Tax=Saitoella complicata (strain BCRC 22490 / CBS 7301 / JCM 7358 / NBRC 10748 / NRRL Y-17804) TaxID=698492 RepID=UPI0008671734|nr:HIT-like protein [Saitoella complicata NRRL Y-17804]ODQ50252.1 HIT-like protein [Saitoella complicata NRRL Y-17804]